MWCSIARMHKTSWVAQQKSDHHIVWMMPEPAMAGSHESKTGLWVRGMTFPLSPTDHGDTSQCGCLWAHAEDGGWYIPPSGYAALWHGTDSSSSVRCIWLALHVLEEAGHFLWLVEVYDKGELAGDWEFARTKGLGRKWRKKGRAWATLFLGWTVCVRVCMCVRVCACVL